VLPTTILVDDRPRCVVRATDTKDLNRFLRNAKGYLLAEKPDGKVTIRAADPSELGKWQAGLALHRAWGGAEEDFFGLPLWDG
jgi:hypothetical protein